MRLGLAGRLAQVFLASKLTPLIIAASLGLGALALLATPREEEPQIRVPMVDVAVAWPGAEPEEVERACPGAARARRCGESAGVEHVYGTARPGLALVTVRFLRRTSPTRRAWSRSTSASPPWARTLPPRRAPRRRSSCTPSTTCPSWPSPSGARTLDSDALAARSRRSWRASCPRSRRRRGPTVIGGQPRVVRVEPDPDRMAADRRDVGRARGPRCRPDRRASDAGTAVRGDARGAPGGGPPLPKRRERRGVVAGRARRPARLRARRGPRDRRSGRRPRTSSSSRAARRAATARRARRTGVPRGHDRPRQACRARTPPRSPEARWPRSRPCARGSLPADVHVEVTRNYGETAREKSQRAGRAPAHRHPVRGRPHLAGHGLAQRPGGRRRGAGDAGPHPLHLLPGRLHPEPRDAVRAHLLHRDPGGRRHRGGGEHRAPPSREARPVRSRARPCEAVDEVGNPTILATFTVIAAILPMAFVRGLMGPVHAPHPHRRLRGHALLAGRRLRGLALGGAARLSAATHRPTASTGRPTEGRPRASTGA